MIVKLPFGCDTIAVDLRGLRVRALRPSAPSGAGDLDHLISEAVDRPLQGPSLAELAAGRRDAAVVVPDATRAIHLPALLPRLLERLQRGGIAGEHISVLVACGTHPPVPNTELGRLIGGLPAGVTVVQHDARDDSVLAEIGATGDGVPIRIHRVAAAADLLVTVGGVRHHYFAGFGGGPKLVFPGVAGYREIQANHSRVLRRRDGEWERESGCEPGLLDGNPVAEEIAAAADLRPPDCAVCVVVGGDGRPAFAAAGPWRLAFAAAVERSRQWYEVSAPERFRLVVASGGGAPSDGNLIQAHKALDAGCRFLEADGELLLLADLSDGPGSPDMEPFVTNPSPGAILERLAAGWVQYGHTTLRIVERAARHRVYLASNLDPDICRRLGMVPTADPAAVVDGWRRSHPGEAVAVLAGGAVYPRIT